MTTTTPDLLAADFQRTYDLAPTLDSTIPTSAQPGEPGSHWVARGLLTETAAQLLGRPVRLEYFEHQAVVFISAYVSLAASILTSDPLGTVTAVDLIINRDSGRWALLANGRMAGNGSHVPSPAQLAGLVLADFCDRRSPGTTTCRGPVERPKHLW